VPTGIVSAKMTARRFGQRVPTTRSCHECLSEEHAADARVCKGCGAQMTTHHKD